MSSSGRPSACPSPLLRRANSKLPAFLLALSVPLIAAHSALAACPEPPIASPLDAVCIQDAAGFGLQCTANDIQVASIDQLVILDPCDYPGDSTTFTARLQIVLTAQARYDVGYYFARDGDPNGDGAYTGLCTILTLPYQPDLPYLDLDHTFDPCPGTNQASGVQDTCGDIDASHSPLFVPIRLTSICVDSDGDGNLNVPYCASWRQDGANDLCNSPLHAFPGAPSKCLCDPRGLSLPITVPPAKLFVTKTVSPETVNEPGGNVTFSVQVVNGSALLGVSLNSLIDSIYGDVTSVHGNIVSTTCTVPHSLTKYDGTPGGTDTYTCSFVAYVPGPPRSETDTLTATGKDSQTRTVTGMDDATVTVADVGSQLEVEKTAMPSQIVEPGGTVSFSVLVHNASVADSVTINSLTDNVFGNITLATPVNPLILSTTCSLSGLTLAPNDGLPGGSDTYSCTFTADVTGSAGDSHEDIVTAAGLDDDLKPVSGQDPAVVDIIASSSSIRVFKVATPDQLDEPGGTVEFQIRVENTSSVLDVTIESLMDSIYGDLSYEHDLILETDCAVPQTLTPAPTPGSAYSCTFRTSFTGNAGDSEIDMVTATGVDSNSSPVSAMANATVTLKDVLPVIEVTKSASPSEVPESGGVVTFTVTVANARTAESVELTSLVDDVYGNLDSNDIGGHTWLTSTCDLAQTLEALNAGDSSYTCEFTAVVSGDYPGSHINEVTASAHDDDGNTANATATAEVDITSSVPDISVVKTGSPVSVLETGGDVTFTFVVTNNSAEPATIEILNDSEFGPLAGDVECQVNTVLSGFESCTFTATWNLSGNFGDSHVNTFTAEVIDDEGDTDTATDTETVTFTDVKPSLTLTKSASPTSVPETGGSVTYTYAVRNTSTEAATLDALSDDRLGNLHLQGTCAVPQTLAPGASYSCTVTTTVSGDAPGPWINVGLATGSDDDGNTTTASDDASVEFTDVKPDISITKTADPTVVPETGDQVYFTFVVTNNTAEPVTLTKLVDSVYGNLTVQSTCTVPQTIAGNGSYTCEIFHYLAGDYPDVHTNVVTATASDDEGGTDEAKDDATVTITDVVPYITVTKTASPSTVPETGGDVTFTFVVRNNSGEEATITVLTDSVFGTLAGDADCKVGTVLAGNNSCTFDVIQNLSGDPGVDHVNTFTADVIDDEGNPGTDDEDETVTYTDVLPSVTVTKTANDSSVPETGQDVTYTFVVTNTSTEAATIKSLSDDKIVPFAGDAGCMVGTVLEAGESCEFQVTTNISGDYPDTHVNVFTAELGDDDGNEATDEDTATVTFEDVKPMLTVSKTASDNSVPETGQDVTYTFVVTNTSTEAATIKSLNDDKFGPLDGDADCQVGTVLAAGATCEFQVTKNISGNVGVNHVNTFTAVVNDDDNNNATGVDTETVVFEDVKPTLSVEKTANPTSIPETGGSVTFTFVVHNTSGEPVTITELTDNKFGTLGGDADCQVGTVIAKGGSCDFSITRSLASADYPGSHTNVFTGSARDDENNPVSTTDDATVSYTDVLPDVTVTKTANPTTVPETGGDVTFTFVVTNNSTEAATIKSLSDDKIAPFTGDADCQIGTVLAGNASCTFTVTQNISGDYPGSHVNTFTAVVSDDDGNDDTGTDDETVTFTDVKPSVTVTKTADDNSVPETGQNVTYTFVVKNTSTEAATIKSLSDDKFGTLAGDADCMVGTVLAAGASCDFEVTKNISGNFGVDHVNTFTAVVNDDDNNNATGVDTETVVFEDVKPTLSVTKTANPTSIPETGGDVTFTFVVNNTSGEPVTITALTDNVFGTLAGDDDCKVGTVIAKGGSCDFSITRSLASADYPGSHTNVFTGSARDDEDNPVSATDDAAVSYTDVLPDISLAKTVSPLTLPEPGGNATFTFLVTNNSLESVTVNSLTDSVFGNLNGQGNCVLPKILAGKATYTCSVTKSLAGNASTFHSNIATAGASDDDGNPDSASDDARVDFTNVNPVLDVKKSANRATISDLATEVIFTVVIENKSVATDPVTITQLNDNIYGNLDKLDIGNHTWVSSTCSVPQTIQPGSSYSCSFVARIDGQAFTRETDTVTATGLDDDGTPVSDSDSFTVTILPAGEPTDTSYCSYDRDSATAGRQFRLLYNQNSTFYPNYSVGATNPGQFFMNVILTGTPGQLVPLTVTLPYPFVTQGAMAYHVYDRADFKTNSLGEKCFVPPGAAVDAQPFTTTLCSDWSTQAKNNTGYISGVAAKKNFTFNVTIPATGLAWVNIHLDYGLKGSSTDTNCDGGTPTVADRFGKGSNNNAVKVGTTTVRVPDLGDHSFGFSTGSLSDSDIVENKNNFKAAKGAGVAGVVTLSGVGTPLQNRTVKLYNGTTVLGTAVTDLDGFYTILYSHKGKTPGTYTVKLFKADGVTVDQTQTVTLKSSGFADASFVTNE